MKTKILIVICTAFSLHNSLADEVKDIDNKYREVLLKISSEVSPPKDDTSRRLVWQELKKLLYNHCSDEDLFFKYYATANAKQIRLSGDFITFLWCKSNNPNVRKLLLSDHAHALSSGPQKYGTPSFVDFVPRFNKEEQAIRNQEIQEVKGHLRKDSK